MDIKAVETGLQPTSTTQERVIGLMEAGFDAETLAEIVDVRSSTTIWNWKTAAAEPRRKSALRLDDLRYAMSKLVLAGLQPDEATAWMQSRGAEPPFARPIELIKDDPETVFKTIESI